MIEAIVLLCSVAAADCTPANADDFVRTRVPIMACLSAMPQTLAAGMPKERLDGETIKIICKPMK